MKEPKYVSAAEDKSPKRIALISSQRQTGGLDFSDRAQMVLWRCQWREGTGWKVGNTVFPVFCPPNSVVHALPQTLSPHLSHEMRATCPQVFLASLLPEGRYVHHQLPKHWVALLLVLPKASSFSRACQHAPHSSRSCAFTWDGCWPVLPLAKRA